MQNISDYIKSNQEEFEKVMKEMRKKGSETLMEVFKAFFQKHGEVVKTIAWRQYAPHFNDGEPCEFSVYEPEFLSIGHEEVSGYYNEEYDIQYSNYLMSAELKSDVESLSIFIQSDTMIESMKILFGTDSGVKVYMTSDGEVEYTIDEYLDHD